MGSSGGGGDYAPPTLPTPPNVAPYGSSVPFKPSFINFLGDPSTPSTGLTPDMLAAIDQMYQNRPSIGVQQQTQAAPAAAPQRNKLAETMMRGGNGGADGGSRGAGSGGNSGGWGGK